MDGLATQFHQQHLRFAMQSDHGPAAFVMDNFQIVPIELLPDARAERLTDGFLASEARRDTGGRIGLLLAIRDLVRSKKFVQKFYAPSGMDAPNAGDVDNVDASAENHLLRYPFMRRSISFTALASPSSTDRLMML